MVINVLLTVFVFALSILMIGVGIRLTIVKITTHEALQDYLDSMTELNKARKRAMMHKENEENKRKVGF